MADEARIAASTQQSNGKPTNPTPSRKRPPPPPPPTDRPNLPPRHTVNSPPISTYGSSAIKQANKQPIGARGLALLPPPLVDRDQVQTPTPAHIKSPPQPSRNGPPPLPTRKASQPSPALPPRKVSTQLVPGTQMVRRGSNSSTISYGSTVSGLSLGYGSSLRSVSSGDKGRKLPPAFGEAELPPLPPTRREVEEKNRIAKGKEAEEKARIAEEKPRQRDSDVRRFEKVPSVTVRATPAVPIRPYQITAKSSPMLPTRRVVERALAPKMPPRPSGPPGVPSRPRSSNSQVEEAPPQPARRLPPPSAPTKSILSMGFNNKQKETPNPEPRSGPILPTTPPGPAVIELDDENFHAIIKGKFALVKFYSPYCQNCTEIEPIYKELGRTFAFASDRLVLAEVDAKKYPRLTYGYKFEVFPGIFLIDQRGESEKYPGGRELEPLTKFVEDKTGIKVLHGTRIRPNAVPPPINMSSKPTAREIQAVQSKVKAAAVPSGCLRCRDFSGPDERASKYPRQSLPRTHDLTGYLADVLCSPFSSATDKARVIFTWLHHNLAYDVDAFFGNRVKHVEPKDTITTGLAVCGGYAGLFSAIALKAGLEAVMVTGHGKGFGYSPTKPGKRPPPREPSGHAWNAVRIDGGEWKLLDPCWGAGHLSGSEYTKSFNPSQFTMSNEAFGLKHFPQDDAYFFRADRRIPTWEEYILGPCGEETLQIFGDAETKNAIDITSFSPPQRRIKVKSTKTIRFQFSKVCEHWDDNNNPMGKPYTMILKIEGCDGRKSDYVPFEKNDFWYWVDIKAKDLGVPGQTVGVYSVNFVEGKDARGLSTQEYMRKKGKVAMGPFGGICSWDLV